jgi:hypothetical protein
MTPPLTELVTVNPHEIPGKMFNFEESLRDWSFGKKSCSHQCGTQKDREGVRFFFFSHSCSSTMLRP